MSWWRVTRRKSAGIEIRRVAGGYKLFTKPQQHDVVRRFIKSLRPPLRLFDAGAGDLAVIAYKQPVTSPEISEIRGVNTSGVISTLLDKHLITTAGREGSDGAADFVQDVEGIFDALWIERFGGVAEFEGV